MTHEKSKVGLVKLKKCSSYPSDRLPQMAALVIARSWMGQLNYTGTGPSDDIAKPRLLVLHAINYLRPFIVDTILLYK
jgi:hypothetical protein